MTRQEQIEQEADKFAGVNYDCETEADAFYHTVQKEAFVAGYNQGYKDAINKVHKWIEKWDVAYTHPLVMDAVHKELDEFMEEQQ